jgi:hypothetical protein
VIWYSVTHGTGLGFEDSEDFYKASRGIAMIVENTLDDVSHTGRTEELAGLSRVLDKSSMSLSVDSSGESIYQYGLSTDADKTLLEAVAALGGEGFVSNGSGSCTSGRLKSTAPFTGLRSSPAPRSCPTAL